MLVFFHDNQKKKNKKQRKKERKKERKENWLWYGFFGLDVLGWFFFFKLKWKALNVLTSTTFKLKSSSLRTLTSHKFPEKSYTEN